MIDSDMVNCFPMTNEDRKSRLDYIETKIDLILDRMIKFSVKLCLREASPEEVSQDELYKDFVTLSYDLSGIKASIEMVRDSVGMNIKKRKIFGLF